MAEAPRLDLTDPRVRKMADRHHQPHEMWSIAGNLIDLTCGTCANRWPCETRRALDAYQETDG